VIVDSSAVIAILWSEPDAPVHADVLARTVEPVMSAPTLLEASIVAQPEGRARLDEIIRGAGISIAPFTEEHALVAREAYARYGKGSEHPAHLNFGDCMSYALAKVRDEPLLFKGDDFRHTDVTPAL